MFAIIKTGGKQYGVKPGDIIEIERLRGQKGRAVDFREVLLVDDGAQTLLGTPYLEKAVVRAEIIEEFKDDKVVVFKKKRRKQYKKKRGHRQVKTRLKILEVIREAVEKKEPGAAEKATAEIPQTAGVPVASKADVAESKKQTRAAQQLPPKKAFREGKTKKEEPGPKRSGGVKKET